MKATGLHGIGLAIVDRTRLVYAKGYTWAGTDYPDVLPTTLFRQASVSKTFVTLALYQIMQEQSAITLDTTMQSVHSKLTTPDGKPPVDARSPPSRCASRSSRHERARKQQSDLRAAWMPLRRPSPFRPTSAIWSVSSRRRRCSGSRATPST